MKGDPKHTLSTKEGQHSGIFFVLCTICVSSLHIFETCELFKPEGMLLPSHMFLKYAPFNICAVTGQRAFLKAFFGLTYVRRKLHRCVVRGT